MSPCLFYSCYFFSCSHLWPGPPVLGSTTAVLDNSFLVYQEFTHLEENMYLEKKKKKMLATQISLTMWRRAKSKRIPTKIAIQDNKVVCLCFTDANRIYKTPGPQTEEFIIHTNNSSQSINITTVVPQAPNPMGVLSAR